MRAIAGKILRQQQQIKANAAKAGPNVAHMAQAADLGGQGQWNNLSLCLTTQTPKNLGAAAAQKFSKIQLQAIIDNMYTHENNSNAAAWSASIKGEGVAKGTQHQHANQLHKTTHFAQSLTGMTVPGVNFPEVSTNADGTPFIQANHNYGARMK